MKSKLRPHFALKVFLCFVILRLALVMLITYGSRIGIDEFLYTSLAKSIARDGSLVYRGLNANYSYVLYPLVMSLVYKIPGLTGWYYRLMQLLNILMMSSGVFPALALAREITGDEKSARRAALFTQLLPDCMYSAYILSESLIYPLFYLLLLAFWRTVKQNKTVYLPAIGLLGGLLYSIKPGHAVPAAIAIGAVAVCALRKKDIKKFFVSLASIVVGLGVAFGFYALALKFGYSSSVLGLYSSKVSFSDNLMLKEFAYSVVCYLLYFALAGGIVLSLIPLIAKKRLESEQRVFMYTVYISLLALILGTAWTINRKEYSYGFIQVRYMAMYIPPIVMLDLLLLKQDGINAALEQNKRTVFTISILAALCALLLPKLLMPDISGGIGNFALSLLDIAYESDFSMLFAAILALICIAQIALLAKRKTKLLIKLDAAFALLLVLGGNIVAISYTAEDAQSMKLNRDEELEVLSVADDENIIYVASDISNAYVLNQYAIVESETKANIMYSTKQNLFANAYENSGVYVPFAPDAFQGTVYGNVLPDSGIMVINNEVYDLIEVRKESEIYETTLGSLHLVRLNKGEGWLDSVMGNVARYTLKSTQREPGNLVVYNSEKLKPGMTITFEITAEEDMTLSIWSASEKYDILLHAGDTTASASFNTPSNAFNFSIDVGTLTITGYSIT